ncbi:beta-1,4-galactosyltransferase galt-1-like isoform X1 [Bufo bufo]|uniref:beta-1,4-galactosyltransferase galt-1-like isoform X1 n=2 Tax=Bufo bufo TaxID=8384 RepID=UPI001ABDEFE6|nr:beta-1,4-galactosyltransferase galt-1-like isoform X1 [Bufo bufo]XP_040298413.1 beta-1,4-galactosyltransferase galt-1-like isoform X1 [Bufo bufo]XP_040298414.1 beta-1,4-galactosyltransferase galt-1-like isoform X1 [Bufo bufo]
MPFQTVTLQWQKLRTEDKTLDLDRLSGMKLCASFKKLCKVFSVIFATFSLVYLIYIIVFVKVGLPNGSFTFTLLKSTTSKYPVCKPNLMKDTIVKVKNSKTFLVSAYLDFRSSRIVRILGITYRNEPDSLLCDFCQIYTNICILAEHQVHTDHFDFPYGTTDLLCNVQGNVAPEYVSLYPKDNPEPVFLKIQNIDEQFNVLEPDFQYNFIICISAMFGAYSNELQFIQSMEMYRMLGAQKVIIYHTESSLHMQKILSYYIDLNFVELIPWPITSFINVSKGWHYPDHPGDLHYFGQTAALNDCIYRNMYRSKYIALNDIDELIIPIVHKDWPEMLDYLLSIDPTFNVFIFENHLFPTTSQDKTNQKTPEDWISVPGVNILHHIYREPNRPDEINPTKMIVNPRSIVQVSVHVPLEYTGSEYKVPSDIAKLCHYREPKQKELDQSFLIEDNILAKYEASLIEKVNRVLNEVDYIKKEPSVRPDP